MRTLLFIALLCQLAGVAGAQQLPAGIKLKEVAVEATAINPNLIPNAGFEALQADGVPVGWLWDKRNTDATLAGDQTAAHGGRTALRLTNGTPFGAHVYGQLRLAKPIAVQAGQPYTISAWVKSDANAGAWIGGGKSWQFRLLLPATGGVWQRASLTFVPEAGDENFTVLITTEAPNAGFWIDDVKLEAGPEATNDLPDDRALLNLAMPAAWSVVESDSQSEVRGDGDFSVPFALLLPRAVSGTLHVELPRAGEQLQQPVRLERGAWKLLVKGSANATQDSLQDFVLRLVENEREVARTQASVLIYSPRGTRLRLARLKESLPALKSSLEQTRAAGREVAYPLVTCTVLENFVNYAAQDLDRADKGGETLWIFKRAVRQIGDMEKMAARLRGELDDIQKGKLRLAPVPRWTGAQRPIVSHSSFLAPTMTAGEAAPRQRPVFFTGYGHFGQVKADIEKFPAYGINIVQFEVGPASVFPQEGVVSDGPARATLAILDRARQAGVAVNLLISPHYMPEWMLEKYPHLRKQRQGFLKYCIHAPESREFLKRTIATLIPPLKDHPALHSICLSNEPTNVEEPCEYATAQWRAWLQKRHGDVAALNARWGTNHKSFEEIALPNPMQAIANGALRWDSLRFNQDVFADWHQMLANAVHAAAPNLPVHAKAMTWTLLTDTDLKEGVDATLFGQFSDINGNDAVNFSTFGKGDFAQNWQQNARGHDLQRSVKDAPVFNSENHIIVDREMRPVPPEHVRAALWQAAAHGQSATTLWVWERTFDIKHDFAGSIMHHPACAEAVGRVSLDLNRAAPAMTAIQQAPAQALMLFNPSAAIWEGGSYTDCQNKMYAALSFTGIKPGFVTERQLEDGLVPGAPLLLVPQATHLSNAAFATLQKYRGRLVFVGDEQSALLARDEYDKPREARLAAERIAYRYAATTWQELWKALLPKLKEWNLTPEVELRENGAAPWGIEWRSAKDTQGTLVNLCNYRHQPVQIALTLRGQQAPATDVLTGEIINGPFTLQSLETRLLRAALAGP